MMGADKSARVRRALGAACSLALLVLLVHLLRTPSGFVASADRDLGARPVAATATPAPTPTDSTDPSGPTTQTSPAGPTAQAAPTGGPGLSAPGIALRVEVDADGDLEVAESVRLSTSVASIRLAVPDLAAAAPALGDLHPSARTVQMSAGGQVVAVAPDTVTSSRVIALATPATEIELRYTLQAATQRSAGSTPGRGLGAVGPLIRDLPGDTEVQMVISGSGLLNVTCPQFEPSRQICTTASTSGFLIPEVAYPRSLALLQVNLP